MVQAGNVERCHHLYDYEGKGLYTGWDQSNEYSERSHSTKWGASNTGRFRHTKARQEQRYIIALPPLATAIYYSNSQTKERKPNET